MFGDRLTGFWTGPPRDGDCLAGVGVWGTVPGGCRRCDRATSDRGPSRTCGRRDLTHYLVGTFAYPIDDPRTGGSRIVTGARGQDEVGVHDSAFPLHRRMAHVHGARTVQGDVASAGRERDRRQAPGVAEERGLDEGPVGTGHDPELARAFVGAGYRDPNRQAAAARGVPPEAAVLVPRQVGDPLDDADGLDERLDLVAALVPRHMPVARERG